MIRSVKLSLKYLNREKQNKLNKFIQEYRKIIKIVVGDINKLEQLPFHLDYKPYIKITWLSARSLRRLTDHAIDIIKGVRKINNKCNINVDNINPLLDSNHYDIKPSKEYFNEFLSLKSIGNRLKINIPLKYHKQYHKWSKIGRRMGGIEINEKWVKINFEINIGQKESGKIIGMDQGINKILTVSDGQITPIKCNHGHNIKSIINKLSLKKKGSKAFKRAQEHRKNFINWSINKLNLNDVKEIRIENINNFFRGKNRGRKISHWTHSLIKKKVLALAEQNGVHLVQQDSKYRSQRCSFCGLVKKANRKGEIYSCSCGVKIDSDLNAARNHEVDLPSIGFLGKLNISGFYWLNSGIFDLYGGSLQSPLNHK